MLSGGVDSATVLAALLAIDRPPRCFTFTLGRYESEDLASARAMCRELDLDHQVVRIPQDALVLERDVRRLVRIVGPRKTWVQCGHPYLYVVPQLAEYGYHGVYVGLFGDDLWGTGRRVMSGWRRLGDTWAREERNKKLALLLVDDGGELVAQSLGAEMLDPFTDEGVMQFLIARSFTEMHVPRLKSLAIGAFPEFWSRGAWYREPLNYQIGAGIRAWHDTLLTSPLNRRGNRAVVGIYNDLSVGRV